MLAALARPLQHDLNNLLTVVYANLEMLRRTATEGPQRRQLERVEEAARRIDAGSRAYLSLARRTQVTTPASLTEAVEALRPLLQMLLPGAGLLVLDLEPEGWPVRLDRARFDQALLDLAAMASRDGSGEGLALVAANRPGAVAGGRDSVELLIRTRVAFPEAARRALHDLAEAAAGTLAPSEDGTELRLLLPRCGPPEAPR